MQCGKAGGGCYYFPFIYGGTETQIFSDLLRITWQRIEGLGSELGPAEAVPSCGPLSFYPCCCQWVPSTRNCFEQQQKALFLETRCSLVHCNESVIAIDYLSFQGNHREWKSHSLTYQTTCPDWFSVGAELTVTLAFPSASPFSSPGQTANKSLCFVIG